MTFDAEKARAGVERAAKPHEPLTCSKCPAQILWARQLAADGGLARRCLEDGCKEHGFSAETCPKCGSENTRPKNGSPIDYAPSEKGNILLFDRPGAGIVYRVLKKGEDPPPGARLRTSHFQTCPSADQFRSKQKPRRSSRS